MRDEIWGSVLACVIAAILSFVFGLLISHKDMSDSNKSILHSVGIDHIAKCSIDTPNCHSNWYEIVWIDEKKGTEK